jgi:hypothetical protein
VASEFPDDVPLFPISAAADEGLEALTYALYEKVSAARSDSSTASTQA